MKTLASPIVCAAFLGLLASGTFGCPNGSASSATSSSSGGGSGSSSGSGSGGAAMSSSSSSSSSSSGGGGAGGGCAMATDCAGQDTECQTRTCIGGKCGFDYKPLGTPTAMQTAMDCKINTCDGSGMAIIIAEDSDLPIDNNPCTNDFCMAGIPSNPNLLPGASCGGGHVCDGFGNCLECLTAADCPGQDTQCQTRTCDFNGTCGFSYAPAGTVCNQNGGVKCDGNGACVP